MQFPKVLGSYTKFSLAWLLCFCILGARAWLILQGFQLFAEDGSIFFASAWNSDLFTALATPYAGYYHLLPRLAAEVAALLPYAYIPWTYALIAVALNATAISWLQLPHYRWIIRNDWLRLGIVLLLACSPNLEALTSISYVQWGIAWWAALIILMPLENVWLRTGVTLVYIGAIWTAPILVLLFPIWLARLWYTRSRADAVMAAIFALAYAGYIVAILQLPSDVSPPIDWGNSITDFLRAYAYRFTGTNFLGITLTEAIHVQWGWPFLHWFAGATTLLFLALLAVLHPRRHARALVVFLYIAIASLSFYLLRSTNFNLSFLRDDQPLTLPHRRYFFLASASLFVLLGIMLDALLVRYGPRLGRLAAVLVLILFALPYAPTFVEPALGGSSWFPYGEFLDTWRHVLPEGDPVTVTSLSGDPPQPAALDGLAWEQNVFLPLIATQRVITTLSIPNAPEGWSVILKDSWERMPRIPLGQGLLFAGSKVHTAENVAQVHLFWQYAGEVNSTTTASWQVAMLLIDAGGAEVACQPISAVLPSPMLRPDQLFFSQVNMPLASTHESANWRLRVKPGACPANIRIVVPPPG